MSIKIAYVPLDGRPCNAKFPKKIAEIAGIEIITPPSELLGYFKKPGDCEKLAAWLEGVSKKVDRAVVSVEMIIYGGLIASRGPGTKLDEAMKRIEVFRIIKRVNPKIEVSAFSIIMRLSTTAGVEVGEELWKKIFRYSELFDLVEEFGLFDDKVELSRLEKEIPQDILYGFLGARARNHEVNKKMLQLISEGNLDFLVVGEDDVAIHGLHRKEREALKRIAAELLIGGKVKMICGADEVGMMLVAKNVLGKHNPKIFVAATDEGGLDLVPLYEDRPLLASIVEHIDLIGAIKTNRENDADLLLFVNAPQGKQRDLFLDGPSKLGRDFKDFVGKIKGAIGSGKAVAIADVAYANGADPEFMEALLKDVSVEKLASFSAWNTASNSIGSALAQAVIGLSDTEHRTQSTPALPAGREHRKRMFLLERFIDDYLYQTILRQRIKNDLQEAGTSIYDLKDEYASVNWVVKEELKKSASDLAKKHFKDVKTADIEIDLPWPRIFEININLKS